MIKMTVRRRKRVRRFRGTRTHGWGIVRTHRGSGMRGGVGKASPKSHHWIQTIKGLRPPIGKKGFVPPPKIKGKATIINVSHLEAMLPVLIKEGTAIKKGNIYQIDLTEMGYMKLLAQGSIDTPVNITIDNASERAVKKIETAGGKVTTSS